MSKEFDMLFEQIIRACVLLSVLKFGVNK